MQRLNNTLFGSKEYIEGGKYFREETEAFESAREKLSEPDRVMVDRCHNALLDAKIKNLGERGAMELLAKLGIFIALNAKS